MAATAPSKLGLVRPPKSTSPGQDGASMRAFFKIVDEWAMSAADAAILLGVSTKTVGRWEAKVDTLSHDTRERVAYVLGIYGFLCSIFDSADSANMWIHAENADFGGGSPLSRMLAGNVGDLFTTFTYVTNWLNGIW
jgi:uncharacterized protein (DUF2384 family)